MKPMNLHDMLDALDDLEVATLATATLPKVAEGFVASARGPKLTTGGSPAALASADPDALDGFGPVPWHGAPAPVRWWRHSVVPDVAYVEIEGVVARAHRGDVLFDADGGPSAGEEAYWIGPTGVLLAQRASGQVLVVRGGAQPSLGAVRASARFEAPPRVSAPVLSDWLGAQEPWLQALYQGFAAGSIGDVCLAVGVARRLGRLPRATWQMSPLDPAHPARVPHRWRHALSAAQVARAHDELRERIASVHDDLLACLRDDALTAEAVASLCQHAVVVRDAMEGLVDLDLDPEGHLRGALDDVDETGEVLVTLRGLAGRLAGDPAAAAIAANLPDAWWGALGEA